MAVAPEVSTAPAAPPVVDEGAWRVETSTDPMDDVTNVTLGLGANEPLGLDFPYRDDYAALVIRCRKGKTDAYVVTHVPVKTNYSSDYDELGSFVRMRFNDEKPVGEYWSQSTDHSAVFAPSPISFAQRIAKGDRLVFEFTPFDAAATSVTFSTKGLSAVLPKVATACHWE